MIRVYYMLTKPGIIFGNIITTAAGFLLASQGHLNLLLFLATLGGLSFIIASASVFNNYIDRHIDGKMARTKNRPFVKGIISVPLALLFAVVLVVAGFAILALYTNLVAAFIALAGFFIYVVVYSLWKSHSIYATFVGSIAGAVPPVVGYCAVSGRMDVGALILFAIIILWQMPHFFSIAIYRFDDYAAASIPVLPVKRGMRVTKIHMLLYIIAFLIVAQMLTLFGYTGYFYLTIATLLGLAWLFLCIKGFNSSNEKV